MTYVIRGSTGTGVAGAPVTAGEQYSAAAQLISASVTRNGQVNILWYQSNGAFISRSSGSATAVTAADWVQRTVTATAPGGAAFAAVEVEFTADFGESFYADQLVLAFGDDPVWSAGGGAGNVAYVIERSRDGGTTWEEVRGATRDDPGTDVNPATTRFDLIDYEAWLNRPVLWRAFALAGDSMELVSVPTDPEEATIAATTWWLRDPLDTTRDIAIYQAEMRVTRRPGLAGAEFFPEGRADPVVVHASRPAGDSFNLVLWAKAEADFDELMLLLSSRKTLCVQNTLGMKWYVRTVGDVDYEQIRAKPSASETFPTRHFHQITAPVLQVAEP